MVRGDVAGLDRATRSRSAWPPPACRPCPGWPGSRWTWTSLRNARTLRRLLPPATTRASCQGRRLWPRTPGWPPAPPPPGGRGSWWWRRWTRRWPCATRDPLSDPRLYPVPPTMLRTPSSRGWTSWSRMTVDDGARAAPPASGAADRHRRCRGGSPGQALRGSTWGLKRPVGAGVAPVTAGRAGRLLEAGLPALAGTWSHLATPEDPAAVAGQVARFEDPIAPLAAAGVDPGLRHLDVTGGAAGRRPARPTIWSGSASPATASCHRKSRSRPGRRPRERPAAGARPPCARGDRRSIDAGARRLWGDVDPARPSIVATLPPGYADGWRGPRAGELGDRARAAGARWIGRISSDFDGARRHRRGRVRGMDDEIRPPG